MRPRHMLLLPLLLFITACFGAQSARDLESPIGHDTYIACGKRFSSEIEADQAVASCPKERFSCEKVEERGIVSLIKGKIPSLPRNYKGPYGRVIVVVTFDEAGIAKSAKIIQSPDEFLSQLAINAVMTHQVYPSCKNGVFIPQQAQVPFDFLP